MRVRWLVAVVVLASLSACGDATSLELSRVADPYDGPMSAQADYDDDATPAERAAGAGLALECDGDVYAGGGGNYDSGPEEVQDEPDEALEDWMEQENFFNGLPTEGYRLEREDGGRMLFSFDVEDRTKVAFILYDGTVGYGGKGWGVESYGACDPSEWPAEVTEELGIGVFTDPDGARVPVTTVTTFRGSEHCGEQDTTFLTFGEYGKGESFVGNPSRSMRSQLRATYEEDVALPADATDTGFSKDELRVWLAADGSAAYLVGADGFAERWPAPKETMWCA